MDKKPQLIGTAPSLQALANAICYKFYCGTSIDLIPNGKIWNVVRVSDGKVLEGVQVSKKARRYRFEML